LSETAALLVPVEVVCQPIPVTDLAVLEPLVIALRKAGAVGTGKALRYISVVYVTAWTSP